MFGRKKNKIVKSASVFEVKKKHSWRGNLLRAFEIGLIVIVVVGTLVWLLIQSHFSLNNAIKEISQKLRPEISIQKTPEQKTSRDELIKTIEDKKVIEINTISDVTNGFEVKGKNNVTVVFSTAKDFASQVTTLQTLLAKAKIDNKTIKKVDFRFDKVVVVY